MGLDWDVCPQREIFFALSCRLLLLRPLDRIRYGQLLAGVLLQKYIWDGMGWAGLGRAGP